MTEKTGVRICIDRETRKGARKGAALLDIELNEFIRFAVEYVNKVADWEKFKKKVALLKRKYDRQAKKA